MRRRNDEDPHAPARGILMGLALSLPLWGLIGGLLYVCLRLWGK